jgi:hypothetical protein
MKNKNKKKRQRPCPKKHFCQRTSGKEAKKMFGIGLKDDGDEDMKWKYTYTKEK